MTPEAWVALFIGLATIALTVWGAAWYMGNLVGKSVTKFESIGERQAGEITEMKTAIERLEDKVGTIAVDRERANGLERRIATLERWYDELRHGQGFIRVQETGGRG